MIHRVLVADAGVLHLREAERRREPLHLRPLARRADERRVEVREVARDDLRRIPLRVHAHEHELQVAAMQLPAQLRHQRERRRANIRAVREARKYQAPVALQVRAPERTARLVDEAEVRNLARLRQRRAGAERERRIGTLVERDADADADRDESR